MSSTRQAIAHAATPWAWKSRRSVVALAALLCALFVWAVIVGVTRGDGLSNKLGLGVFNGVIGYFLFARPGLRNLRRWDDEHVGADGG